MSSHRPPAERFAALLFAIGGSALLTGCATLIGAAIDPTGTATAVANDSLNSLTHADASALAGSSTSDIDRILAEHPDADNADQLKGLRGELANQPGVRGMQYDDLPREYRTQHDRRLTPKKRHFTDNTVVAPLPRPEDISVGMRDTSIIHPHGVDAPRDPGPAYTMETQQLRFGH